MKRLGYGPGVPPLKMIRVGVEGEEIRIDLIGPCTEGFLYRLTNTFSRPLAAMEVVGDNDSFWNIKALRQGESAEIRSPSLMHALGVPPQ